MKRSEAYHILGKMWENATMEQAKALSIAQDDIEFVDLIPEDMVAVVRCKDCKHWEEDRNGRTGECFHELWEDAEGWSKTTEPTEFCSRGERRTDDAD